MHAQDLHRSKLKKTLEKKLNYLKRENVHYIEIYQKGKNSWKNGTFTS